MHAWVFPLRKKHVEEMANDLLEENYWEAVELDMRAEHADTRPVTAPPEIRLPSSGPTKVEKGWVTRFLKLHPDRGDGREGSCSC